MKRLQKLREFNERQVLQDMLFRYAEARKAEGKTQQQVFDDLLVYYDELRRAQAEMKEREEEEFIR